jgi:hypothetical protein
MYNTLAIAKSFIPALFGRYLMFDSLADRMKEDDSKETSSKERAVRYVTVLVVSIIVFGGLYFGISALQ